MRVVVWFWSSLLACCACAVSPAWVHAQLVVGERAVSLAGSRTVVVREDELTVLTHAPRVRGDGRVALVLAVPAGTTLAHAGVVPSERIDRLDLLTAPRLTERWERDPCDARARAERGLRPMGGDGGEEVSPAEGYATPGRPPVAQPGALADPLDRAPYDMELVEPASVEELGAFFDAHGLVRPARLSELDVTGRAFVVAITELPPHEGDVEMPALRVSYHQPALELLLSLESLGPRERHVDRVLFAIQRGERMGVAGHDARSPTDLVVRSLEPREIASVHQALFEQALAPDPAAFVLEHAMPASLCDACPGGAAMRADDLSTLGAGLAFPAGVLVRGHVDVVPPSTAATMEVRVEGDRAFAPILERRVRQQSGLRFCYERILESHPGLGLTVTVPVVRPAGRAPLVVGMPTSSLEAAQLSGCVRGILARLEVPEVQAPATAQIRLTFRARPRASGRTTMRHEWIVTRLHARAAGDVDAADVQLVPMLGVSSERDAFFEPTPPAPSVEGLELARPPVLPRFDVRYAVHHAWEGPLACESPVRGAWGAPLEGEVPAAVRVDVEAEPATREQLLAQLVDAPPALVPPAPESVPREALPREVAPAARQAPSSASAEDRPSASDAPSAALCSTSHRPHGAPWVLASFVTLVACRRRSVRALLTTAPASPTTRLPNTTRGGAVW